MIPYLIPVILIIIGIYRYDVQQRSVNSRYLYWFIGLYLILLFGLRFQLGWDSRMYSGFWQAFPSLSDNYDGALDYFQFMQPGFQYLWFLCKQISPDFWFFQIVHCSFVVIVPMWFIRKHTKYHFVGLLFFALCYCWYFCTEIIRESISISIFLLVFDSLIHRKWIKYFIGCFFAFMFHYSAAIMLLFPVAILLNLRLNKMFVIVIAILVALLFSLRSYVGEIATWLGGTYGEKLLIYNADTITGKMNANWMILRISQTVAIPLLMLLIYKYKYKQHIPFESIFCLMILFGMGILVFEEIFVRFTNYPMPIYLVSSATLVGTSIRRKANKKILGYSFLLMIIAVYLYNPIKLESIDPALTPYKWVVNFD
ncbi:MAG: EpsG family protein [Porphyromonadaceae bacterium]|nr:EpsG family protein [Porphyromonadaceae bacterium]